MSDIQRGNTKHGPRLDEQMEQESRGMVQGHGSPHAEPFRETEPLPDDTDPEEIDRAFRHEDGGEETEAEGEGAAPEGGTPGDAGEDDR